MSVDRVHCLGLQLGGDGVFAGAYRRAAGFRDIVIETVLVPVQITSPGVNTVTPGVFNIPGERQTQDRLDGDDQDTKQRDALDARL